MILPRESGTFLTAFEVIWQLNPTMPPIRAEVNVMVGNGGVRCVACSGVEYVQTRRL